MSFLFAFYLGSQALPPSCFGSHTHCVFLVLSDLIFLEILDGISQHLKKKKALRELSSSELLQPAGFFCLLLTRPHNKPLVDVLKMFIYLKTKVIRANGNHLSSCLVLFFVPSTNLYHFCFRAFPKVICMCHCGPFILTQGLILSAESLETGGCNRDRVSIWQRCVIQRQGGGRACQF